MPIQIGVVGLGIISNAHLSVYRDFPEKLQIGGVCDIDEERAKAVAAEFDVQHWTDYEEMLNVADIEAVDLMLPHYLNYPVAKAALEAGKHVLVEKPFATEMTDCLELVDIADRNDLTVMVGQKQRYHPPYRALKTELDEGMLGQIHHGRIDAIMNLHEYAEPPHWFYDGKKAGGGPVISLAIHKIDLLRYFLGDVRRVIALGKTVDPAREDAEDYCVGLLEFENGTLVDLFTTHAAPSIPYDEMFWLFGEDGAIHTIPAEPAEGYVGNPYPRINRKEDGATTKNFEEMGLSDTDLPTDDDFTNEILHFAECIDTGEEPISGGKDNIQTMATIFAIYESLEADGAPVMIDDVISDGLENQ